MVKGKWGMIPWWDQQRQQPIRARLEVYWPIRGWRGPPAPVSFMSINNTKLTSMLRRREKTQQILSTSNNTSLEIWLMDLMNEKMGSSGKTFFKRHISGNILEKILKLSDPELFVGIQSETTWSFWSSLAAPSKLSVINGF